MSVPRNRCRSGWSLGLVVLLALAGAAARAEVLESGVDLWTTVGSGVSHASFAHDPIPADFFCPGSKPFTGKIRFSGAPLASHPEGSLCGIDTIIRRLDDAAFDEQGRARTRIQLLALSLASVEPIETECGRYQVTVALDGEQPTTEMEIRRTRPDGGTYVAPLALRTKAVFTPLDGQAGGPRRLTRTIELGTAPNSVWSFAAEARYASPLTVDTDGDGQPDTLLPPASNFVAGYGRDPGPRVMPAAGSCGGFQIGPNCPCGTCPVVEAHCSPCDDNPQPGQSSTGCASDHLHEIWICVPGGASGMEECCSIEMG